MAAQSLPQLVPSGNLSTRRAVPEDAAECGRICYEAFFGISTRYNFPPDFESPVLPTMFLSFVFGHPMWYCVVGELDGQVVGSNCMDERSTVAGIGPITIDPEVQDRGVGRALMQAVLDRAAERKTAGVRLVQAAFHNRSLTLYTKLGFATREPLSCMQGTPPRTSVVGLQVRAATEQDLAACDALCLRVHGHDRHHEMLDAIRQGTARVVERGSSISGYTTGIGFFGHTVGESNDDLKALIAAADTIAGPGMLVPTRNFDLFRWCLESDLRVIQPMTLMSTGLYNEPAGAFLPSILF